MDSRGNLTARGFWQLVLVGLCLIALKALVVDRIPTPFRHSLMGEGGALPDIEHPLSQVYADGLQLIGYDRTPEDDAKPLPADEPLRVDLYWTVWQQPMKSYQTVLHLVGPDGLRWSTKDSLRPTDYEGAPPTSVWQPGQYAIDSHEVHALAGTPPGTYELVLTVFDRDTLAPLSMLAEEGQPAGPKIVLGQVRLGAPQDRPGIRELDMRYVIDARLGALTLLGASVSRDKAAPGDPVEISGFWRAEDPPAENVDVQMWLLAPDGFVAADYAFAPAAAWHPTAHWDAGDIWRGQHLLHLPADLASGTYTWTASLSTHESVAIPIARLSVTAPERVFTRPEVAIPIDVLLGDVATLVGGEVTPTASDLEPEMTLTVTLTWRSETETHASYRVFVHLIGPEGRLIAQSDGIPGQWTRPTTGWVPGEYVSDVHNLVVPSDAPAGEYRLAAGLYAPEHGRLTTADGADAVQIGTALRLER